MVNGYRIKEAIIPAFTVNGSVIGAQAAMGSSVINGEIVKIKFPSSQTPGSVWLYQGDNNIEVWRKNDFTSGLAAFEVYPIVYGAGPNNVTGSPQAFVKPVVNDVIFLSASGLTSGTGNTFGPVEIYYR